MRVFAPGRLAFPYALEPHFRSCALGQPCHLDLVSSGGKIYNGVNNACGEVNLLETEPTYFFFALNFTERFLYVAAILARPEAVILFLWPLGE